MSWALNNPNEKQNWRKNKFLGKSVMVYTTHSIEKHEIKINNSISLKPHTSNLNYFRVCSNNEQTKEKNFNVYTCNVMPCHSTQVCEAIILSL